MPAISRADRLHSGHTASTVTVVDMETSEQMWGAPAPAGATPPAHWSTNKTLAAVGIAAVLAAGGAAVIYAADSGGSGAAGGPAGGPGFGGPPGSGGPGFGGPGGGGPGAAALPTALHGQFVVPDGHGGFTTEVTQTGTITDISSSAITARSEDGFTQTYVITTNTRQGHSPVQAGDTATIRGVTANDSTTATAISPQR
jgi:hypothetical protein